MDATILLGIPKSTLGCLGSYRINQVGFCHFHAAPSSLSWRNRAQFSEDFKHMLSKQRKANLRSFAFNIKDVFTKHSSSEEAGVDQTIHGEVILQKVSLFNITDYAATIADEASELMGNRVYLQLVSGQEVDPETGVGETVGEPSVLKWNPLDGPAAGDTHYEITFKWKA